MLIEALENFIELRRPEENIRHLVDLTYKIENQSVRIHDLRPHWKNPELIMEGNVAKATYIKNKNHWKIFWPASDGGWHPYSAQPTVKTISEFTALVAEDKHNCFFG